MTERMSVRLYNPQRAKADLEPVWQWIKAMTMAGNRLVLDVRRETRTLEQNSILWSILTDLSQQCEWAVDGQMVKLPPEDVKHILTASLKRHQRMARGIDGGLVILGQSTSRMTVAEVSELIELGHAVGADRGVKWSRTSLGRDVPDCVAGQA